MCQPVCFCYIAQIGDFVRLFRDGKDLYQITEFGWHEGDCGPIRAWQETHKNVVSDQKAKKDRPVKRGKLMIRIGKAKLAQLEMVPPTPAQILESNSRYQCITEEIKALNMKAEQVHDRVSLALIN
jgi:hypothetical protein